MTNRLELSIFSISVGVTVILATLMMITTVTHDLTDLVFAQGQTKFEFNLTGSEEVPPVQTNATAIAEISAYTVAGDTITYRVNAMNIKDVTAGHIHLGKADENGPIVFTLFKYDPPKNEVSESGTITADKLEGPMKGKKVYDVALAGSHGSLYMNIHTVEHPNGEIRGTSIIPP
jgi:hypothetical protein